MDNDNIVMNSKTMKAAKRHPIINKKLKYFMLMGHGTEDGCHHLANFHGLQSFTIDDNKTTEGNFPDEEVRIVN